MITIHWQLIPLIIVVIVFLLMWLIGGSEEESEFIIGMFGSFLLFLVVLFYICLGLYWLFTHIKII